MNRNEIYQQLEENLVTYKDVLSVPVQEIGDPFVTLKTAGSRNAIGKYAALTDMKEDFPNIPVRTEVADMLNLANSMLKRVNADYQLVVTYGFRSLEVQQQYFDEQRRKYPLANDDEMLEVIHRSIAVPEVAGHPTGGAVDVYIMDTRTGESLNFGTPIYTFDSKDVYTFSPFIDEEAQKNRWLLRETLMTVGFAPYDGEWWHFSFGDKEWAFYYQQPCAVYAQKTSSEVLTDLMAQQIKYCVVRPGGNDTALVAGIEPDPNRRKLINDAIMRQNPNVEQVGFIQHDLSNPRLLMAGGEFCGNATRSTAWKILNGKTGEVLIRVSGVRSKLKAGVDVLGNAWAQMPVYANPNKITFLENGGVIVPMEGITHAVVTDTYPNVSPEELKQIALKILEDLELTKSVAAAGVMFVSPTKSGVKLRPVVFVRDVDTLFYETACGSGTTAIGLIEALRQKKSVSFPVIQPTGTPIIINVTFDGDRFQEAIISGSVCIVTKKKLTLTQTPSEYSEKTK